MQNGVFFPQAALDRWIGEGTVDLRQSELEILEGGGRRYRLADAVHVVREVSGAGDPFKLVGRVKALSYLDELGAEIVETSMLLGDGAYDIESGWLGVPFGPAADAAKSDEEVLTRLLGKKDVT